ncbi:hypothetical protein [Flexibacterium corallicola]|uniref:hypothetical protein n=1 Tax=Flexibacterium corallicola TaxID=3037259 RepID=UPI00286F3409|nr:hypothetical protein [Pseudovibrio sp. M1P-2-3]
MGAAELIILVAIVYCVLGACVALPFLVFGIGRVEDAARGAYWFRPQLLPGLVLLWPIVLVRWRVLLKQQRPKEG